MKVPSYLASSPNLSSSHIHPVKENHDHQSCSFPKSLTVIQYSFSFQIESQESVLTLLL